MNPNLLTVMERAGSVVTFRSPTQEDRAKIDRQFTTLRLAGHALVSDETVGRDEPPVIRVFHYKTCAHPICSKGVFR